MPDQGQFHNDALRQNILENPAQVLGDHDVMRALVGAEAVTSDRKVVDLRGVMVDRLEERIGELEDTQRDVVSAAYELLTGSAYVNRAALALIRPQSFDAYLKVIATDLKEMLNVDAIHICVEGEQMAAGTPIGPAGELRQTLIGLPKGGGEAYFGGDPTTTRPVVLRSIPKPGKLIYGHRFSYLQTEALLRLDLGQDNPIGFMAMASAKEDRFTTDQGTDLLEFLSEVASATLLRWLN